MWLELQDGIVVPAGMLSLHASLTQAFRTLPVHRTARLQSLNKRLITGVVGIRQSPTLSPVHRLGSKTTGTQLRKFTLNRDGYPSPPCRNVPEQR